MNESYFFTINTFSFSLYLFCVCNFVIKSTQKIHGFDDLVIVYDIKNYIHIFFIVNILLVYIYIFKIVDKFDLYESINITGP